MTIKWQKQVVIKQKTEIHTEARCVALKVGLNSTDKERKDNKGFVKTSFSSKLINGGPNMVRGVGKQLKNL